MPTYRSRANESRIPGRIEPPLEPLPVRHFIRTGMLGASQGFDNAARFVFGWLLGTAAALFLALQILPEELTPWLPTAALALLWLTALAIAPGYAFVRCLRSESKMHFLFTASVVGWTVLYTGLAVLTLR